MKFDFAAGVGLAWTLVSPMAHAMVVPRTNSSTNSDSGLLSVLSQAVGDPSIGQKTSDTSSSILSLLDNQKDTPDNAADVGSVRDAHGKISQVYSSVNKDSDNLLLDLVKGLVEGGLIPLTLVNLLDGYINIGFNSIYNNNPAPPSKRDIYPTNRSGDAAYSISEERLRAAIHIPDSFAYGKNGKKPVILVPGTAIPAGMTYHFSFSQLGEALPEADVVWVNIPRASLNDAQTNAEYVVAYAINYISAISSDSNVAAISWSQGGLDVQWVLKYWPSTRDVVEDFIAISPDFHGTDLRLLVCPLLDPLACTPSIWQQGPETEFIHTLRADGGDSAYVPTTTVYSSFDEIVQPMSGPNASAILSDIRDIGVTNNHIQTICPNQPAGGIYLHEGVLYNALAWALAVDALTHDGPGDPSRIDIDTVCGQTLAPQLQLDDMLGTEGILLVALVEILTYEPKVGQEPSIAGYAS